MALNLTRWSAILVTSITPVLALSTLGPACKRSVTQSSGGNGGAAGAGGAGGDTFPEPTVTVLHPDAPPLAGESTCEVVITTGIHVPSAVHVPLCSAVKYATNPPSGGDHWGLWAAFKTYDIPVPREQYVHNLEHGALVMLHRCQGECPDVLAAFEDARASVAGDPLCLQIPDGPKERVLITPDPFLDTPVAVAAWGATYTATCLDKASLLDFAKMHYGHGTEAVCAQGSALACMDMDGGVPDGG